MRYIELRLGGAFRETGSLVPGFSPTPSRTEFRHDTFVERVHKIIRSRRIDRVLVLCEPGFTSTAGAAALQAIRTELDRIRQAAETIDFYAVDYGVAELYLGSACSARFIHPLGSLSLLGLASELPFFRKLLSDNKISVEVLRRGKYKSAGDAFRLDRIDPLNKEQHQALLQQRWDEYLTQISNALGKPVAQLEDLVPLGILSPAMAIEHGVITELITPAQWRSMRSTEKHKPAKLPRCKGRYGRGKRIAVLFFEGMIVDGRSRRLPLLGQAVGDQSFESSVEKLRKDSKVAGVVLRINSGGGSAVASENIFQSLHRLAIEKPLYVSMGNLAASGGYWISLAAHRSFADQLSVTGSIGVIRMAFNLRELLRTYGVSISSVKTHPFADFPSSLRKLHADERGMLQRELERIYRSFIAKTAEARKRPPAEIEELAEGRVWSGYDAVRLGLVDEIAPLPEVIEQLKRELGLSRVRVQFAPRIKRGLLQRLLSVPSNSTSVGTVRELMSLLTRPQPLEPSELFRIAGNEFPDLALGLYPAAFNRVDHDG